MPSLRIKKITNQAQPIKSVEQKELSIEETIANTIYDLKQQFGETRITAATIHLVLKETIELVENFSCPSVEKREHVVNIVRLLIIDLVDDPNEEKILLEIIDKKILENTIDLIILATKGKLNINNKVVQKKVISYTKSVLPVLIDGLVHLFNSCKPKKSTNVSESKEPAVPTDTSSNNV